MYKEAWIRKRKLGGLQEVKILIQPRIAFLIQLMDKNFRDHTFQRQVGIALEAFMAQENWSVIHMTKTGMWVFQVVRGEYMHRKV